MCVFVSVPNAITKVWAKHSGNDDYVVNTFVWKADLTKSRNFTSGETISHG